MLFDIIIIGAGAAGMAAAKQLSQAGLSVCVLEARERLGGRINTIEQDGFGEIETGAEFIHGNLETTLGLLAEAGMDKQELQGDVWQVSNGKWKRSSEFFEHAEAIVDKLKEIENDMTIGEFLEAFFSRAENEGLRRSLTSYVEGYYSGVISKTSAKSFLKEWMSEDDQQYRPIGGYGQLIGHLADEAKRRGVVFRLSIVVKKIKWSKGWAEVVDESNQSYRGGRVVITIPLGVWTADTGARGAIDYDPALPYKTEAAKQMGFGSVIKVLLAFKDAFWEDESVEEKCGVDTANFHMALSDEPIPTWWSQLPKRSNVLTGWVSGPNAHKMKNEDDALICRTALESLSRVFNTDLNVLQDKLSGWKVYNWTIDPFTRGSYSYSTVFTSAARKIMNEPVANTLFFAGEALYDGPEMGTVEAALISGSQVAEQVIQTIRQASDKMDQ